MFVIKNNIRYLLINYASRFSLSFKKPFLLIPLTMKSKTSSITTADKGSFLTCLNVICGLNWDSALNKGRCPNY